LGIEDLNQKSSNMPKNLLESPYHVPKQQEYHQRSETREIILKGKLFKADSSMKSM